MDFLDLLDLTELMDFLLLLLSGRFLLGENHGELALVDLSVSDCRWEAPGALLESASANCDSGSLSFWGLAVPGAMNWWTMLLKCSGASIITMWPVSSITSSLQPGIVCRENEWKCSTSKNKISFTGNRRNYPNGALVDECSQPSDVLIQLNALIMYSMYSNNVHVALHGLWAILILKIVFIWYIPKNSK
jgi:hypothetical protein